jgi:hypothetical protein
MPLKSCNTYIRTVKRAKKSSLKNGVHTRNNAFKTKN